MEVQQAQQNGLVIGRTKQFAEPRLVELHALCPAQDTTYTRKIAIRFGKSEGFNTNSIGLFMELLSVKLSIIQQKQEAATFRAGKIGCSIYF